jgi:hypothetical protein
MEATFCSNHTDTQTIRKPAQNDLCQTQIYYLSNYYLKGNNPLASKMKYTDIMRDCISAYGSPTC